MGGLFNFDPGIDERCDRVAEAGDELSQLWDAALGDDAQRRALLDEITNATTVPLGDVLVNLLGDANEAVTSHRDALNDLPSAMRDHVVNVSYDAALQGMHLAVDFGQAVGRYSCRVTTVFDVETSQFGRMIEVYVPTDA